MAVPSTTLPDADALLGAERGSAARADVGLGIFTSVENPPMKAGLGAPRIDPTDGGRRRAVGVGSAASGAGEAAAVPIRTVLGGAPRRPRPRLRRQAGIVALTLATAAAGLGSAWTVRAVFAHGPQISAPAVWPAAQKANIPERAHPAVVASSSTSERVRSQSEHRAASTTLVGAGHDSSGSSASGPGRSGAKATDRSGTGTHESGSGKKRSGSGKNAAAAGTGAPSGEVVHHHRGKASAGGGQQAGGADDPVTHDTAGAGSGSGASGGGGGGGGADDPTTTTTTAPNPTVTTPAGGGADSSGSGSGSGSGGSGSGGGGGGGSSGSGSGHDDPLLPAG